MTGSTVCVQQEKLRNKEEARQREDEKKRVKEEEKLKKKVGDGQGWQVGSTRVW